MKDLDRIVAAKDVGHLDSLWVFVLLQTSSALSALLESDEIASKWTSVKDCPAVRPSVCHHN